MLDFDRHVVGLQVHLAKVNGQKVVVKVQRPGLRELFDIDCKNIRVLAEWLQKFDPKSDGAARDWVAIYDECQKILYQVPSPPPLLPGKAVLSMPAHE